jgi:hypothetical protein
MGLGMMASLVSWDRAKKQVTRIRTVKRFFISNCCFENKKNYLKNRVTERYRIRQVLADSNNENCPIPK